VRLGIGEEFLKSRNPEEFLTASGHAGGPTIFFRRQSREKNYNFPSSKNPFVSYKQIPTVASKKRIQVLDPENTALSAPTPDYEFHPGNQTD